MPLHNQSDDHDLISTEEAKQIIDLYAQREKQRLKEAERIANMPKLADIASLLNTSVEQLRPMLLHVYVDQPIRLTLDANGEEHLSHEEANDLIEYATYMEEQRQKELERKASMTSVQEVAANLGITEEEAQSLLKEVRVKKPPTPPAAPPVILANHTHPATKALKQQVTPPEPSKSDSYAAEEAEGYDSLMNRTSTVDSSATRSQEASAVILIVVLLFVLLLIFAFAGSRRPSPSYTYPYSQSYTYPTVSPAYTSAVPTTRAEVYNLGQKVPSTITLNSPMPPQGWTVKVYGPSRMVKLASEKAEEEPKLAVEAQLRECVRALVSNEANMYGMGAIDYLVPLAPISQPMGTSDISQWASVVATDGKVTRMVYLPLTSNLSSQQAADAERRMDYLVGKSSLQSLKYLYPKISEIKSASWQLPKGFRLTANVRSSYFQAEGKNTGVPNFNSPSLVDSLHKATAKFVDELEAKHAFASVDVDSSPLDSIVCLRYEGGFIPLEIGSYLKALRSGSADDKSLALMTMQTRLQTAVQNYQAKTRSIR